MRTHHHITKYPFLLPSHPLVLFQTHFCLSAIGWIKPSTIEGNKTTFQAPKNTDSISKSNIFPFSSSFRLHLIFLLKFQTTSPFKLIQTISESNSNISFVVGLTEANTTQPSRTGLDQYFEPCWQNNSSIIADLWHKIFPKFLQILNPPNLKTIIHVNMANV